MHTTKSIHTYSTYYHLKLIAVLHEHDPHLSVVTSTEKVHEVGDVVRCEAEGEPDADRAD